MDPVSPEVAATRARSWLFAPATRPERFAKAAASGADRVIVDLEDAVAPEAKAAARSALGAAALPGGVPVYLRVNGADTSWFEEDLRAAASLPIAGVVLPKAETPGQIARVRDALAVAGARAAAAVVALVETAAGVWNVLDLARAPGVERLAFGAIDFGLDAGVEGDGEELAFARSRLVLASRVAGIAPPIDAVTPAIDDEARLVADLQRARRYGFGGKLCIHPRQVAAVHRAFAPSPEDVAWARALLDALARIPEGERGAFAHGGAMVDRPVIDRARRILASAGG